MDDTEIYAIIDLNGYASDIRIAAATSLSTDGDKENLDDYITISQIINLVKSQCLGYDDQNRPMLNEDINEAIYENIVIWIHNAGLAKLCGQNLIECAWDDDLNEMVFWAKQNKTKKEKKNNAKRSKSRRKNMGDEK